MIYGCERILAIAAGLGESYQQALKMMGRPTIVAFYVPMSFLSEKWREQFADLIRRNITRPRRGRPPYQSPRSIILNHPVPPEHLAGI
jgi:hypothetical protein